MKAKKEKVAVGLSVDNSLLIREKLGSNLGLHLDHPDRYVFPLTVPAIAGFVR